MSTVNAIESFTKIEQSIRSGKIAPWYCFVGKETFFLDRLQTMFEELVPEDMRDFNFDLMYARDVDVGKVLSVAKSFPMMADRRVLIVRDFMQLGKNKKVDDDDDSADVGGSINELIGFLEKPNPNAVVVFIDGATKPSKITKIGKALAGQKTKGVYAEFESVPDTALPHWIMEWAQQKHSRIFHVEAAELLAYQIGDDLQLLSTEIDKLCTFEDSTGEITMEAVKKISGFSRSFDVFDLKNALFSRDRRKTFEVAEHMLQQSDQVTGAIIPLLSFFYATYIKLWQIKRLEDKGLPEVEIQRQMGLENRKGYFFVLKRDASQFRSSSFPFIFEALFDADKAIKGFLKVDKEAVLYVTLDKLLSA